MEKMEFPWLRDVPPPRETREPEAAPEELSPVKRLLSRLRPFSSQIGIGALILGLALMGRCSNAETKTTSKRSVPEAPYTLMMSLVGIPKGHKIVPEALSEVHVRANTLSKTQRLRALNPDHLPKLNHSIVAKKDIPPQTPIFWSDLALEGSPRASRPKTRVIFDKQGVSP